MSDYNYDLTNYVSETQSGLKDYTNKYSETETREVFVGDGKTPPTVIIPQELRSDPAASIYCFGTNAEGKELYHVVNQGIIPHQNINAGLRVLIGKPPNDDRWHILRMSPAGLMQTGGMSPNEIRTQQERQITPDRAGEIRLKSNGTLIPDFIGGKVRLPDGEFKTLASGAGPDLTSLVPATPNKEVWVTVGIDPLTGAFDTASSAEFDLGTSSFEADAPRTVGAGYEPFQSVKLANADTETQDGNMMLFSGIPTYGATTGGGGMTSFTVAGDSGTPEAVEDGNTLSILGGTGLSSVASATDTITMNLDNTAVTPASYTYASITVDQQGRITAASNGAAPGTMSSFDVNGDSGTPQTITNGNTLLIAGGAGIDTVVGTTDTLTIAIDSTVTTNAGSQTLTNKTLTAPTIGDFTNATHNHQNAAGGGTLDAAAVASGTLDNARVNWAAPGTIGSTTPNTGVFTAATVLNTSAPSVATLNANAGQNRDVTYQTAGSTRWVVRTSSASESGSDAGSNFHLERYNDSGTLINIPLFIARSTGTTTFSFLSSSTSTVPNLFNLSHSSSGTPAAGFGVSFNLQGHSSTNTMRNMGDVLATWTDATDASRKGRLTLRVFDTAIREGLRIEASGTAPMIGFLGANAVARPTLTGAKGGNVALANLITLLATYGLLTDSTT